MHKSLYQRLAVCAVLGLESTSSGLSSKRLGGQVLPHSIPFDSWSPNEPHRLPSSGPEPRRLSVSGPAIVGAFSSGFHKKIIIIIIIFHYYFPKYSALSRFSRNFLTNFRLFSARPKIFRLCSVVFSRVPVRSDVVRRVFRARNENFFRGGFRQFFFFGSRVFLSVFSRIFHVVLRALVVRLIN